MMEVTVREQMDINTWAEKEGWAVFLSSRGFFIDKDNDSGILDDDDTALSWVTHLARSGSELHKRALDIHLFYAGGAHVDHGEERDEDDSDNPRSPSAQISR